MTTDETPSRASPSNSRRVLVAVALAVIAVDLATKAWASAALDANGIDLPGPLDLRLAYNRGVAFSLLSDVPVSATIAITALATAVLAIAAWRGLLPSIPAGLILGGALANLLDRLQGGSVVDLLHTGWWPTFNLADAFLTIGVVLLLIASVVPARNRQANSPTTTSDRK